MSEKRTHRLSVKLTSEELEDVQSKAKTLKMDLSSLARLLLLNANIKVSLA